MNAPTDNTSHSTQDDAGVPPAPPEAHQQAGDWWTRRGEGASIPMRHPKSSITASVSPPEGDGTTVVELHLAPALGPAFTASFPSQTLALRYLVWCGYEPALVPHRIRIGDFRDAIDHLNEAHSEVAGSAPAEFQRIDVPSRLRPHIERVEQLRPGVDCRYMEDLERSFSSVERARELVKAWRAVRGGVEVPRSGWIEQASSH